MSMQEKLFLKKIRKLEEQKIKVVQQKKNQQIETQTRKRSNSESINEFENIKKTKTEDNNDSSDIELKEPQPLEPLSEIFSDQTFDVLKDKICEKTFKALTEKGFTRMTEIQARTIPILLEGKDLVGTAKTGSGKTLAFLIPIIELMYKLEFKPRNGTGAIIISPTRELSLQTYSVLSNLMKYHSHTYGLVIGKSNRKEQAKKLSKGINILIATPGRLLDHIQNTPDFMFKNLQCIVFDETDRILDIGFKEEIEQIIKLIPKRRQTIMFSATQSKNNEMLQILGLKKEPIQVTITDSTATVTTLEQAIFVVPSEKRLISLYNMLSKQENKKVMVFFSTCNSVEFHTKVFAFMGLKCMNIHGKQKQEQRFRTFRQYSRAVSGILLCTDVASRGLDFAAVDLVIQYDPPEDAHEYIHRVGRTARGEGSCGRAILFLRTEECKFLGYLNKAKVPLKQAHLSPGELSDSVIQEKIEDIVSGYVMLNMARESFVSFVRAYKAHRLKDAFDSDTLDLDKVAVSFGLRKTPQLDYQPPTKTKKMKKNKHHNNSGEGYYHSGVKNNYDSESIKFKRKSNKFQ